MPLVDGEDKMGDRTRTVGLYSLGIFRIQNHLHEVIRMILTCIKSKQN